MPPPKPALLAEEEELVTVSVPSLWIAPPKSPTATPWATVSFATVSFAPAPTTNTRTASLPLMVIFAFWPLMFSPEGSVMVGSVEPSTMVAFLPNEKWIASSSVALPALQSGEVWALSFAFWIASRNEHLPSLGVVSSSLVVTLMAVPATAVVVWGEAGALFDNGPGSRATAIIAAIAMNPLI